MAGKKGKQTSGAKKHGTLSSIKKRQEKNCSGCPSPSSFVQPGTKTGRKLLKGEYTAEFIVAKHESKHGDEYLVKWKGYPFSKNTWEPRQNLVKCQSLIDTFEETRELKMCHKDLKRHGINSSVVQKIPHKIIGTTTVKKQRCYVIQWSKTGFKAEIIPDKIAKLKWPQLVAQFNENLGNQVETATESLFE